MCAGGYELGFDPVTWKGAISDLEDAVLVVARAEAEALSDSDPMLLSQQLNQAILCWLQDSIWKPDPKASSVYEAHIKDVWCAKYCTKYCNSTIHQSELLHKVLHNILQQHSTSE
jgi:hypothetical protein